MNDLELKHWARKLLLASNTIRDHAIEGLKFHVQDERDIEILLRDVTLMDECSAVLQDMGVVNSEDDVVTDPGDNENLSLHERRKRVIKQSMKR